MRMKKDFWGYSCFFFQFYSLENKNKNIEGKKPSQKFRTPIGQYERELPCQALPSRPGRDGKERQRGNSRNVEVWLIKGKLGQPGQVPPCGEARKRGLRPGPLPADAAERNQRRERWDGGNPMVKSDGIIWDWDAVQGSYEEWTRRARRARRRRSMKLPARKRQHNRTGSQGTAGDSRAKCPCPTFFVEGDDCIQTCCVGFLIFLILLILFLLVFSSMGTDRKSVV